MSDHRLKNQCCWPRRGQRPALGNTPLHSSGR